ncbi:MAG: hypothetical protein WBE91_11260 [Steroidobacteraceae bacterium]
MLTSRRSLARAIAAVLLLTSSVAAFGQQEIEARKAASFVDSMGINVHFEYTQTPYVASYTRVRGALQALGIRNIRDEINGVLVDGAFKDRLPDPADSGFKPGSLALTISTPTGDAVRERTCTRPPFRSHWTSPIRIPSWCTRRTQALIRSSQSRRPRAR